MSFPNLNSSNEDFRFDQSNTLNIYEDLSESLLNSDILFNTLSFPEFENSNENQNSISSEDSSNQIFIIHKVKRKEKNGKSRSKRNDNILRRLKVHFFKFLITLCNDYIKFIYKDSRLKFKNITSELISDVTIELNSMLKDCTLKNVLYFPINKKFIKSKKDINISTISTLIRRYPQFKKFFNYKICELFELFTEESKKDTLKQFGIKKAIPLYDLVKKEKTIVQKGKEYTNLLLSYGKNYFDNFHEDKKRKRQNTKKSVQLLIEIMKNNQD